MTSGPLLWQGKGVKGFNYRPGTRERGKKSVRILPEKVLQLSMSTLCAPVAYSGEVLCYIDPHPRASVCLCGYLLSGLICMKILDQYLAHREYFIMFFISICVYICKCGCIDCSHACICVLRMETLYTCVAKNVYVLTYVYMFMDTSMVLCL